MRLELNLHELLAGIDLVPFFIVTSGIVLFWIVVIWALLFVVDRMR